MALVLFLGLELSCLVCNLGHYNVVSYVVIVLQLRECVTRFGAQVEAILSQYGKGILRKYTCLCVYACMYKCVPAC